LGDVAQQLFLLPTQLGVVGAQQLELAVQVEQAALELSKLVGHLRVELGLARTLLLVALLELLPQVEDRAARLVIVEQPRLRGRSEQGARQCGGAQATGHASHGALQRLTSSARRFFAHASSSLRWTAGGSLPSVTALRGLAVGTSQLNDLATDV